MKRFLCIIAVLVVLLVSVSCDFSNTVPDSASRLPLSESSSDETLSGTDEKAVISLKKFKSAITNKKLGEIAEIKGDYGYDAALVTAEDGTNYIYMYLADSSMAKSVLTDCDGDGKTDPDFSVTAKGDGYTLYTQESRITDSSDSAIYSRCVLAGRMILVISGSMENKEIVKKNADSFLKSLGYEY